MDENPWPAIRFVSGLNLRPGSPVNDRDCSTCIVDINAVGLVCAENEIGESIAIQIGRPKVQVPTIQYPRCHRLQERAITIAVIDEDCSWTGVIIISAVTMGADDREIGVPIFVKITCNHSWT